MNFKIVTNIETDIFYLIINELVKDNRIWFGENEAHKLWGDLNYMFEIDFTNESVGDIILGKKPGIIRPELNFKHRML